MSTAATIIARGNQTATVKSVVPWIVGGVVAVAALWVISKL